MTILLQQSAEWYKKNGTGQMTITLIWIFWLFFLYQ